MSQNHKFHKLQLDIINYVKMNKTIKDLIYALYNFDFAFDILLYACTEFLDENPHIKSNWDNIRSRFLSKSIAKKTILDTSRINQYIGMMSPDDRSKFFSWCVYELQNV